MDAESIFRPITQQDVRRVRAALALQGLTVQDWARQNGYPPATVQKVMSGDRPCIRGKSFQIARKIGLREDPSQSPQTTPPQTTSPPSPPGPASQSFGRTGDLRNRIADGDAAPIAARHEGMNTTRPNVACDRSGKLQGMTAAA